MNIEIRQFNGPHDWGWVQSHVSLLRVQDTCGIMAIDSDTDTTVGAILFDNFLYNSAQTTIIATTPMLFRHPFLYEGLNFIFEGCGKDFLYCFIPETNIASLRLSERIGFKEKMRVKEGYGEKCDFVVKELDRNECKIDWKYIEDEVA
jgi:hypothetical protein